MSHYSVNKMSKCFIKHTQYIHTSFLRYVSKHFHGSVYVKTIKGCLVYSKAKRYEILELQNIMHHVEPRRIYAVTFSKMVGIE